MSTQTTTTNSSIFRLGDLPKNVAGRVVKLPKEIAEGVSTRGRDVWLAGLGALATVEEEGSTFFQTLVKQGEKLVERGQEVEKQGKAKIESRVGSIKAGVETRRDEVAETVETRVYEPVMEAVAKLGVPTRAEVQKLSAQVESLTERVNLLLAKLGEEPAPAADEPAIVVVDA